ncbi:MAG TPA: hypothetical protein PLG21_11645, partial [Anaerolineae bacterium]|nr:hypothetical protein [Anaerolineae bacterium]
MGKLVLKGATALLLLLLLAGVTGCGAPAADVGWAAVGANSATIYALTAGRLHALNRDSGLQSWQFPQGNDQLAGLYGEPALAGNTVIFGTGLPTGTGGTALA